MNWFKPSGGPASAKVVQAIVELVNEKRKELGVGDPEIKLEWIDDSEDYLDWPGEKIREKLEKIEGIKGRYVWIAKNILKEYTIPNLHQKIGKGINPNRFKKLLIPSGPTARPNVVKEIVKLANEKRKELGISDPEIKLEWIDPFFWTGERIKEELEKIESVKGRYIWVSTNILREYSIRALHQKIGVGINPNTFQAWFRFSKRHVASPKIIQDIVELANEKRKELGISDPEIKLEWIDPFFWTGERIKEELEKIEGGKKERYIWIADHILRKYSKLQLHKQIGGGINANTFVNCFTPSGGTAPAKVVQAIVELANEERKRLSVPDPEIDIAWVDERIGKEEKIGKASEEMARLWDELIAGGDQELFSGYQIELAEILFDIHPKSFRGVSLGGLVGESFFSGETKGKKKRQGGPKGPRRRLREEEILALLTRLEEMISRGLVDLPQEEREVKLKVIHLKIVNLVSALEQEYWRFEFVRDRGEARNRLRAAIKESKEKKEDIRREALEAIQSLDQKIQALEGEIKVKRINGKPLFKEGKNLSYDQMENIIKMQEEKKVILGDDPGLGKTIQMLTLALLTDSKEIFFAVGPLIARQAFINDIKAWLACEIEVVEVSEKTSREARQGLLESVRERNDRQIPRIQIWNFHHLRGFEGLVKELRGIDFIGLDESHWIKHEKALRSKAVSNLQAPYMILATGTAVDNEVGDLRMLLKLTLGLEQSALGDEIRPYLENNRDFNQIFNPEHLEKLAYLRQLLKRKLVRHRKESVLEGLPVKHDSDVYLNLESGTMIFNEEEIDLGKDFTKQRVLYEEVFKWLQYNASSEMRLAGINLLRHILSDPETVVENARNGGEKKSELKTFIAVKADELDDSYGKEWASIKLEAIEALKLRYTNPKTGEFEKTVIFSNYVQTLKKIGKMIGGGFRMIYGDVPSEERVAIQQTFQKDSLEISDIGGTYPTAAISTDYTRAKVGILESPGDKDSSEEQAIDRMYRRSSLKEHPHQEIFIHRLIVNDIDYQTPSADEHYRMLNRHKQLLAQMLEDGKFLPEIVEEFNTISQRRQRGFFEGEKETPRQRLRTEIGRAMFYQEQGDYESSRTIWDRIAEEYSKEFDSMSTHTIKVAVLLKLLQLQMEGKVDLRGRGLNWGFVPSGPSMGLRVMYQLKDVLRDNGIRLADINGIELDFSKEMLEEGKRVLEGMGLKSIQQEMNVVEEKWEEKEGIWDVVESSGLWIFPQEENEMGVSGRVWFLSEGNRLLKKERILVLTANNRQVTPELIKALEEDFGFEVLNEGDYYLEFKKENLKEKYGDENKEEVQTIYGHTRKACVIILKKVREISHNVEDLQKIDPGRLAFEYWDKEEEKMESFAPRIAKEGIDLREFGWDQLNLDDLLRNVPPSVVTMEAIETIEKPREFKELVPEAVDLETEVFKRLPVIKEGKKEFKTLTAEDIKSAYGNKSLTKEDRQSLASAVEILEEMLLEILIATDEQSDWSQQERKEVEAREEFYARSAEALRQVLQDEGLLSSRDLGGIDLNPNQMTIEFQKEDEAVALDIPSTDLTKVNFVGLSPVVLSINSVDLKSWLSVP